MTSKRQASKRPASLLAASHSRPWIWLAAATLLICLWTWPRVDWFLWRPAALLLDIEPISGQRAQIRWDRASSSRPGWGSVFYFGRGTHHVAIAPLAAGQEIRLLGVSSDDTPWLDLESLTVPPGWSQIQDQSAFGNTELQLAAGSAPLTFLLPGSRLAFAFAATPLSGPTRVSVDGRSQVIDLRSAEPDPNRVWPLVVLPDGRTVCRALLPYGRKATLRLAAVSGDGELVLRLRGLGWEQERKRQLDLPVAPRAIGKAKLSRAGNSLLITLPDREGSVEFPGLAAAVTPSLLLRFLVAALWCGVIWLAVLSIYLLGGRLARAPAWEPQAVPVLERRLVLAAALTVHILVALSAPAITTPDSLTYYLPAARRIFYAWTIQPQTFLPIIGPGYPAFIEIVNRLVGDASALVLMQHLLMALASYTLWYMVRERTGPLAGWLTAAGAILCPYLLAYPSYVLTEAVYVPLFTIALYLASRRLRSAWLHAAALGALVGVISLVRVQALLLLPFVLALAWGLAWPRQRRLPQAALMAVACIAVLAPVSAFNAKRGYPLPASGTGRNLLAMASIHDVLDWSEPELLVSTGLSEESWARAFFHPYRRPASQRRYTGYGWSLVGLPNSLFNVDFTWSDPVQTWLAKTAFARNDAAYWRGVALSLQMLLEARSDFYYRECLWDTQQFIGAAGGVQLGPDGKPEPRPTPSLTARFVAALLRRIFVPGFLLWVALGGLLAIPIAVLDNRRDPLMLCFAGFAWAYLLSLALMINSISRYTLCVYLPLLGATLVAGSTAVQRVWQRGHSGAKAEPGAR
jgi:hypothetical protein